MEDLLKLKSKVSSPEFVLEELLKIISCLKKSQRWELSVLNDLRAKENECYLFQSRLSRYHENVKLGVADSDTELNKITYSLLQSIDNLDNFVTDNNITTLQPVSQPQSTGFRADTAALLKEKRSSVSEFFGSYKTDWDSAINKSFLEKLDTNKDKHTELLNSIWNLPKEKIKSLKSDFISQCPDELLEFDLTAILESMNDDCMITVQEMIQKTISYYSMKRAKDAIGFIVINSKGEFYKRILYEIIG